MSKLVASHLLADRAIIAVKAILNKSGALAEEIRSDYGEDLLVQTSLKDRADSFRILIKVKGTTNLKRNQDKKFNFRLKTTHLRRWATHIEPIIVCVYDAQTENIYSFLPTAQHSIWHLSTTNNQTINIKFDEKNIFDEKTANRFIWQCRISHWSNMLAQHENHYSYMSSTSDKRKILNRIVKEGNMMTFYFLKDIGIIKEDEIDNDYIVKVLNCSENFCKDTDDDPLLIPHAFSLSLLGYVDEKYELGLPLNLLEHGSRMLQSFLHTFHRAEWNKIEKIFVDAGRHSSASLPKFIRKRN